ncbi:LamG domain-containing protein [Motiliproteus sediminis]|uniref:LamG domain-containing protein n=1 Tax=Motiliproteus sediminis TaxID=1468178 RepID=UPI001AEF4A5C|nr:LamG domain-containing protein [Motiliproteus sediminis]
MEVGVITLPATRGQTDFPSFPLQQAYDRAPLIFVLAEQSGAQPSHVRIKDATTTGFRAAQVEPSGNDGPHAAMTVHYLAVEPGIGGVPTIYTLPDGRTLEVGTISTREMQYGNSGPPDNRGWESIAFSSTYTSPPVLIAGLQTVNNEPGIQPQLPSDPWLTVAVDNLSASGVDVALERSEVYSRLAGPNPKYDPLSNEVVGYVVMEAGLQSSFATLLGTVDYETQRVTSRFDGWDDGCDNQNFTRSYANPRVFASRNSRVDLDGGWLRRCSLSSTRVGLSIDEDQRQDSERRHTSEGASLLIFSDSFFFDSEATAPSLSESFKLEADSVVLTPGAFTFVPFKQYYYVPPAVFLLEDSANPDSSSVRIRNVTSTGFEVAPVEPPRRAGVGGSVDQPTTIHYVAAEYGLHQFPDGTRIEVGVAQVSAEQGKFVTGSWQRVPLFTNFPANPAMVAEIQTMNNEPAHSPGSASTPWLTATLRNVTGSSAEVALERAEVSAGVVAVAETVAYMAVENKVIGSFRDIDGQVITGEGLITADSIRGPQCVTTSFAQSYADSPLVVATKTRRDGGDGGWLRRCSLSGASVGLLVDEDQASDTDRSHTTEQASAVVFSASFAADFSLVASYLFDNCDVRGDGFSPDYSGNDFNAVPQNGAETTSGRVCKAVLLDGEDDYLSVADDDLLDDTSQFSAMIWVNPSELQQRNGSNARGLFAKRNSPSNLYAYGAFFLNGSDRLWVDIDGVNNRFSSNTSFSANNWYHVALVFDGSQVASQRVRLYVNGVLDGTFAESSDRIPNYASDLHIGNLFNGSELKVFKGIIDEFKLFRRALTAEEVVNHMGQTRACAFCSPVVDHYAVSHDGVAVSCRAELITITAHNVSETAVDPGGVSLALNTSTGRGQWAQVVSGSGTLSGNSSFNGQANYQFPGNGETAVTLALNYPLLLSDPETVNINLSDGAASESSSEDPDLSVALTGFLFSSVPTQISGKDSDQGWNASLIEVQAVRASDSDPSVCEALFNGSVTVELGAECSDPASCSQSLLASADDGSLATAAGPATAIATNGDNGAAATSAYSALSLNFTNPGARAYLAINYPDSGMLQLFARHELLDENGLPSGSFVQGGSNPFVVRPFGLGFSNIDDGAVVPNPAGEAPGGAPFIAAGAPFQFDLGAYRYAAGEDLDVNGVPDAGVDISDNGVTPNFTATAALSSGAITPAGGTNGVLTAGPVVLVSGQSINSSASYNEVGSVELVADVSNYLGASDADVSGNSGSVGRFYPAEWALLTGSSVLGSCNNVTYMEQPGLAVDFTLEARNAAGLRTQHYDEALMGAVLAQVDLHAVNAGGGTNYGARLSGVGSNWSSGIYSVSSSTVLFGRTTTADGPFDALQLSVSTSHGLPESISLTGASGTPASLAIGSPTRMRYGRLAAENAFGPETESLPQPLRAQYFAGSGFVLDSLNDCTEIPYAAVTMNAASYAVGSSVALVDGSGSSLPSFAFPAVSGTALQLIGGDAGLSYSAPGAGNMGTITLDIDLSTLPWLQFDWDDDGSADAAMRPATVTFGRYRGNDRVIYWQENFTR